MESLSLKEENIMKNIRNLFRLSNIFLKKIKVYYTSLKSNF